MSVPFYVAPEQVIADRAEFARKGISRGRSLVAMRYADGIVLVADNPSPTLHKISEIYDRIGFGAVGRYNEFEALRIAGIQYADLRGYSYDRRDVTARGLAKVYAGHLGNAFSSSSDKPLEVELLVAEIGDETDAIFTVGYDGTIADHADLAVIGGASSRIRAELEADFDPAVPLERAIARAGEALQGSGRVEAAVLDRTAPTRRTFRRIEV